jgi:two-component system, OmpR family, osmolarity sensor histidine kinase EnvZ
MNFDWLKRYMPRGLYGRAALILLFPIITLQLVVSVVFIQRHFEDVTRQMTRALALDLILLERQIDTAPTMAAANVAMARVNGPLQLSVSLPAKQDGRGFKRAIYDLSGRMFILTLKERLPSVVAIDLARDQRRVILWLQTRHGIAQVSLSRQRISASNPHQFLVLMVFVGALMTLVAFLYLRNQLRPIKRLARASEAFGKGQVLDYQLAGAVEVRAAGQAFLDMRDRIERQIEQRTMMLSGVSHDLRTPLTRLKLGLSLLDGADTVDLKRDIADMERLLDEFLAFARGDALDDPVDSDLFALLRGLVDNAARLGRDIAMAPTRGSGMAVLRPLAICRAVENLVENALRYGNRAVVSASVTEAAVTISVQDDGPGIAPEQRDEALKPFVRLDAARNQDRGSGVGLGLSIANDIARRHGGSLRLGDSAELGGLRVDIVLPR